MLNRRFIERYSLQVPATISYSSNNRSIRKFEALSRNISAKGAFLVTKDQTKIGGQVKIEFMLPVPGQNFYCSAYSRMTCQGKVVRTEHDGIAVNFSKPCKILPQ